MRTRSYSLLLAAAACATLAHASPGAVRETDLLAAREAFDKRQVRALESWRTRFAGHLLEAYPAYWYLAAQIERADPAEVHAFLARHAGTPLAEGLRRDWLKALGAAGAWEAFRATHPTLQSDDPDIVCYALQSRLARKGSEVAGDEEALAEARALFVSGRGAPPSCDAVFTALLEAKRVTPAQTWDRIRKLLAAGATRDARRANALLPAREALNEKALDRAGKEPEKYLAAERAPKLSRAATELVLYAIGRLARSKPEDAAARAAFFAGRLGPDEARYAWGQIGYHAALAHHPRALEWYELAEGAALSDAQYCWKARAGMRANDWNAVFSAIRALSPDEARESNWRYWRARALRAKGSAEAADKLLHSLARENGFYGLLAAEDLGLAPTLEWKGWQPANTDLERVAGMAGIQRALALYRVGLANEGFREWWWAVKALEDRDLLAASQLAREANLPDRAINTSERTVQLHNFGGRYPLAHQEALSAAARKWDLNEAWLFAIIRQESRFMPEARSSAGAVGLMQLMPATARWVARQIPVPSYRAPMLVQPELNVQMGTYYYRRVLTELGDPVLAAAAYNAGPGRARRWRDDNALEGAIYVETIPFDETRDYVRKVVANTWYYSHRLTGRISSMRTLLGNVPARGRAADAIAANLP